MRTNDYRPVVAHCDYCHRLGLVEEVLCFECNQGAIIDHGIETIENRMNIRLRD